jgi:tRNA modification GTPase
MPQIDTDTICAIATPPGRSGVGIIRVSGPGCRAIAGKVLGVIPQHKQVQFGSFMDSNGASLDTGLALFFNAPHSYTGEDVLELQGHGGNFLLNGLLNRLIELGARLARPGEFSERSFLNNKMDLLQAEAVADIIDACSGQAARSALRTLQGEFSKLVEEIVAGITKCRVLIEASIDFSEEDIDFIANAKVRDKLTALVFQINALFSQAQQGALLKEGMSVVIAGKPNAGKSSLLNTLSGREGAIVTDIPGTTRDTLVEEIQIDGLPVHIVDTAGLRKSDDLVEQEGVKRALIAIGQADQILLLVDGVDYKKEQDELADHLRILSVNNELSANVLSKTTVVISKIDLLENHPPTIDTVLIENYSLSLIHLSAQKKLGMNLLIEHLKEVVGFNSTEEGVFSARRRHLDALTETRSFLNSALQQLEGQGAIELVAEDLRLSQRALGNITGEFTSDDLLGEIFSSFCVGK